MSKNIFSKRWGMVALLGVAGLIAGCQTTAVKSENNQTPAQISQAKKNSVVEGIIENLNRTDAIQNLAAKKEFLTVAKIQNNTNEYIDTPMIMDTLLKQLLKAKTPYILEQETTDRSKLKSPLRLEGMIKSVAQKTTDSNKYNTVDIITFQLIDQSSKAILWSEEKALLPTQ